MLYARMKGVTFLLTGDIPSEGEPDCLPKCDILKVAHHGSRDSTSEALLAQARPELALISVGADHRYGHPHSEVLERIKDAGAKTLRTDRHGCITLWIDEDTYQTECFLSE